eukprot:TRINITY_DN3379_c0_g3_i1.p1 TRINITY_DN3379_c0_g3~~TRINITY_DN3379_c0_g3_i1.p1  ORF type:complete len:498 (-),score=47.53 TRINITY_DN3379_c0_g3_i1:25-1518(-)
MIEFILVLILFSVFSFSLAVVYESTGEPCPLGDFSSTDLSIDCPSQVIYIPANGTITAIRVGLIIEHPLNWDLQVALLSPHRYWNGSSSGPYRKSVWALNTPSTSSLFDMRTPAMLYCNFNPVNRPCANLGSPGTNESIYFTSLADPYFGYDASYWMGAQNRDNVTGMFGGAQLSTNTLDQKVLTFIGETAQGEWNLVIGDIEAGDAGTLIKWLVEIKYCGDGEITWPEECEGGNNCTSQCKCEEGTRPDPNTLGACIANSTECGDGIAVGDEECDGGYGCSADCTCQQGWVANEIRSRDCQLIGKQYTSTPSLPFSSGGVDNMINITIEERGTIQSIKFGILVKHRFVTQIYLWLVLPNGTFPDNLPRSSFNESKVIQVDQDPTVIKLIGSYGSFLLLPNLGNIQTGRPLFIGSNTDPNFNAPRLNVAFKGIEGDRTSPERLQAIKIASLLGQDVHGTYQIVGGDHNNDAEKGTLNGCIIEVLFCGDGIYHPWHEQ